MQGVGQTEHGPSWQRVRKTVEDTANEHLRELLGWGEFSSRYMLSYSNEPDTGLEDKARTEMLGSLYKKIKREEDETEREKISSRRMKYLGSEENTPESDTKQQLEDDALACIKFVFDRRGRENSVRYLRDVTSSADKISDGDKEQTAIEGQEQRRRMT